MNRGTLMQKPKCPTSEPAPGRNCLCCQRLALREEAMGTPQMTPVLPTGVEIWKVKQLIRSSGVACSEGPSMGSLIIPPQDQTSQLAKILADEFESASNIQLLANCLSVLEAITSVQKRLKLQNEVPSKGAAGLLWYKCNGRRKGKESQHRP